MSQFLIAVDVGNSRIKFGLFDRSEPIADEGELPRCLNSTGVPVEQEIPWHELREWTVSRTSSDPPAWQSFVSPRSQRAEPGTVTGIIAGANPACVNKVLEDWPAEDWPAPRVIQDPARFPLTYQVDQPMKVGIDRLLNAVAANILRPEGRPAILVDTGTATTVDYITAQGAFAGGAILPGFELSARALHDYTALLPLVSIDELATGLHEPVGTNTRQALRSGLFWGQLGAVRELIGRLHDRSAAPPFLLLTGGGASLLAAHLPEARLEPHLALQGLKHVADSLDD